jgi:CheY-like chemotaxis protein
MPAVADIRLKVLLVDDQLSHRAALGAELQAMGHDVVEAGNAEDAVALFTSLRPDAVLMDVEMPGHNGHWAAQQIRRAEPEGWTPILFLSGRVSDTDLAAGIECGGDDYLFAGVARWCWAPSCGPCSACAACTASSPR